MKAKRWIASVLSTAMITGVFTGVVNADRFNHFRAHVEEGLSSEIELMSGTIPYEIGDDVEFRIMDPGTQSMLLYGDLKFSYFNSDASQILVGSVGHEPSFVVPADIYIGDDDSRCDIWIAAYYGFTVADAGDCDSVTVSYAEFLDSSIENADPGDIPGGSTVYIDAEPQSGYHIDSVEYAYSFDGEDHLEYAVLDETTGRYSFEMPHAPTDLTVRTSRDGYRSTYYVNADGDITYIDAMVITSDSGNELTNGWYVIAGDVAHEDRFSVEGDDVNLILEDDSSLEAPNGIAVNSGNTLNIWGQDRDSGSVTANGGDQGNAGIGGNIYSACGTVNIYGGTVNAQGATEGAGIGAGHAAQTWSNDTSATVNIYGGIVNARGGHNSAGIGTGYVRGVYDGQVSVNISGGTVMAYAGTGNNTFGIGIGNSDAYIYSAIVLDSTRDPEISIYSDSYTVDTYHHETLTIVGELMDEEGDVYTGSIRDESEVVGKTLSAVVAVPVFTGHSLTLSGDIGVNFFVDLSSLTPEQTQNVTMDFTVNGVTSSEVPVSDLTNEDGDFGFTCHVNSVQMADTITAVLHYKDGKSVQTTYAVTDYLRYVEAHQSEFADDVVALVDSLYSYGHYVQPFLAANKGWTVGVDHVEIDNYCPYGSQDLAEVYNVIDDPERTFYNSSVSGNTDGITLSYSLRLESTTTIRVFVDPGDQSLGAVRVSVNGIDTDCPLGSDGRYCIEISGINPADLDKEFVINFYYADEQEYIQIDLYALSYVRLVMDRSNSFHNEDEAQYAMYALYRYYLAAENYIDWN